MRVGVGFAIGLCETRAILSRARDIVGDAAAGSDVIAHALELVEGEIAVG